MNRLPFLLGFLPLTLAAQPRDIKGSLDHPAIGRYEGCVIESFESRSFEQHALLTAPFPNSGQFTPANSVTLEGKRTSLAYNCSEDRSSLEVFRNYQRKLTAGGFTIVHQCEGEACHPGISGGYFRDRVVPFPARSSAILNANANLRYMSVRKTSGGSDIAASIYIGENRSPRVGIVVLETQPMETGKIADPDAGQMKQTLATAAKVGLYGIFFDTGQAAVKPESKATLEQINLLLQNDPKLQLLVVGHTDDIGDFQSNVGLSQRRAAAVVASLAPQHKSRLTPFGAGMASPVVANSSDANRAKNRRVELVAR